MSTFADLGVPRTLVTRLAAQGIESPFPIQEACLPDALAGRDVVGRAPTGSGKTLAFGIALLARTTKAEPYAPKGLVLVPTRELAAQVAKELALLTNDRGRRIITIYGGTSYKHARRALSMGVDIIVACPGRLEDLLAQDDLDLQSVTTVVVDEADRMADMGFAPAVRRLIGATNENRHVMLFSATLGNEVRSLVEQFTHKPALHDVVGTSEPGDVEHFFWLTPREGKVDALISLLEEHDRAIVFCRTKYGSDRLAHQLMQRGVKAEAIHGDRSQAQREKALAAVIDGRAQVLVATDVAARGIHIEALPTVVHYDPPQVPEDYVHRSGRTGRAGEKGIVISLITPDMVGKMKRLQRDLGFTPQVTKREEATGQQLPHTSEAMRPLEGKAVKADTPMTLAAITALIEAEAAARPEREERRSRDGDVRGRRETRPFGERRDGDSRGGRRDFGDRGPRPERRERTGSDFRADRPRRDSAERGPRREFGDRGPRPERSERPTADFGYRTDRSSAPRRDSAERGPRREFGDRGPRPERGERTGGDFRADRPRRDGAERGPRREFGDRGPRPERRERTGGEQRIAAADLTVTFFNETKGYGFATDERGREIFIHVSELAPNVQALHKGERIAVDVVKGAKGFEGKNVRTSGRPRRRP